jgi:putative DNA primase/helicase
MKPQGPADTVGLHPDESSSDLDAALTNALLGLAADEWVAKIADVTAADVADLLGPTDLVMATWYTRWWGQCLRFSPQEGWRHWNGLIWVEDLIEGQSWHRAILTVELLTAATEHVPLPEPILEAARNANPDASPDEIMAAIRARMRKALRKYQQRGGLAAFLQLAAERPPIRMDIRAYDTDPWLLTCANGTLDLRTGTLRAPAAEDLITRAIPVPYDTAVACPRFQQFLREIFPEQTDQVVPFIQRFLGLALTGVVREHRLLLFWGCGSNGKSTLVDVVLGLLGDYSRVTPTTTLLAESQNRIPNDIARLRGARFVVAQEPEATARLAESLIKSLTGGDRLLGRFLFNEYFEFAPTFKLVLVTNHKPAVRGQDHALWRRIVLLPFTQIFHDPERPHPPDALLQDRSLADTLRQEFPGILAWAVRGCLDWQASGLSAPELVLEATAAYRQEQDRLGEFLEDCIERDLEGWESAKALHIRYVTWATDSGEKRPLTQKGLGMELRERGFVDQKRSGERGWRGGRLRVPGA